MVVYVKLRDWAVRFGVWVFLVVTGVVCFDFDLWFRVLCRCGACMILFALRFGFVAFGWLLGSFGLGRLGVVFVVVLFYTCDRRGGLGCFDFVLVL